MWVKSATQCVLCIQCVTSVLLCLALVSILQHSLVPRPLPGKIEKGSGDTQYIAVSPHRPCTVQCGPIRLQNSVTCSIKWPAQRISSCSHGVHLESQGTCLYTHGQGSQGDWQGSYGSTLRSQAQFQITQLDTSRVYTAHSAYASSTITPTYV